MKLKKLIAAASALTLLGSLAVAVPASAATGSTTVTASVAAQVRSQNEEWSLMHANGTKFVPDSNNNNNIETSGKAHNDEDGDYQVYFAAFYYFDASELLPEGATITSATIDMYQGDIKFSGKTFAVASAEIPENTSSKDSVWSSVAEVMSSGNTDNTAATIVDTTMVELKDEADNRVMRADVTDLIDDKTAIEFAFVSYNKERYDSNRQLSGTATLTITYEYDDPEPPTAPTVSIVDGSKVTENGTGEYADEVATGFIAEVVTKDVAAKSMNVTVNDEDRTAQTITTLTNATAYFKVIVSDAAAEDSIEVYVD